MADRSVYNLSYIFDVRRIVHTGFPVHTACAVLKDCGSSRTRLDIRKMENNMAKMIFYCHEQ